MKASEFYLTFAEHDYHLKNVGFKKKANNKYINGSKVEINIALDRWGWDDERGWGFLVRMLDMNGVDTEKFERPRRMSDIRFSSLVKEGLMGDEEQAELYEPLVHSHPKVYEQTNMWFAFYDKDDLKKVLEKIMPLVAVSASKWAQNLDS